MNPLTPDDPMAAASTDTDEPEINEGRRALINDWTKKIQGARAHWDSKFKQMKKDADFARGKQWPGDIEPEDEQRYVANVVQRHIAQRVAGLYAKNPRFTAKRRQQLDFKIWDETQDTYMQAMQGVQQAQQVMQAGVDPAMVPPELLQMVQQAQALLQDVQEGKQRRQMLERVGKTMEVLFQYQVAEQFPPFKKQMKQLVRRVLTTSVGWVKLGFERQMEARPEDADKIRDITTQITDIERRIEDAKEGEDCANFEAEKQQLAEMLRVLQSSPQQIVREGLVFDFPPPSSIIVDKRCRQLQGFIGARWVAQEFTMPATEVERIYGVDVKSIGFETYRDGSDASVPQRGDHSGLSAGTGPDDNALVRVYEVQDKTSRMKFTIAEGCPVYLKEPAEPDVKLSRFWDLFPLTFNDIEHEKLIYPPSDVELLRHMQLEHNRARQALREHRQAAAPMYATPRGSLSEDDKNYLKDADPHSVIELDGLAPNGKVGDLLQPVQKHGIDPNLYETNSIFDDVLKVAGVQEAQVGGTSGATATEVSTAEGARMASVASNVDDLDDFFNEMARAASQIMLSEFDVATVTKICGPGTIWPMLSAQEIADELMLEVEAGSSGKPNKAAEVKNFMDLAPMLMQIPGIRPDWLARQGIKRMDDRLDLVDAFLEGLPSIQAMNQVKQQGTGDPNSDPNAQGAQGANNGPPAESGAAQPNEQPAAGAARSPGQGMNPAG